MLCAAFDCDVSKRFPRHNKTTKRGKKKKKIAIKRSSGRNFPSAFEKIIFFLSLALKDILQSKTNNCELTGRHELDGSIIMR